MRRAIELSNVHDIVLVFQNSRLVVVHVQVIRCREDGNNRGKVCFTALVHFVAEILRFVGTNDGEEVVSSQKGADGRITEYN